MNIIWLLLWFLLLLLLLLFLLLLLLLFLHLNINNNQSASWLDNLLDPPIPQEHKLLPIKICLEMFSNIFKTLSYKNVLTNIYLGTHASVSGNVENQENVAHTLAVQLQFEKNY